MTYIKYYIDDIIFDMIDVQKLTSFAMFQKLSETQLLAIASVMHSKKYQKNEHVFVDGQQAEHMYLVMQGAVKIYKLSVEGKIQILRLFQTGETFAEVPMFQGSTYPASCQTTEPTILLSINRSDLLKAIKQQPDIALNILCTVSLRLREFTALIESIALRDSKARVANYLLQLSQIQRSHKIKLEMIKTDLANLLNMTRENLSRTFGWLEQINTIKVSGQTIHILDPSQLQAIVTLDT